MADVNQMQQDLSFVRGVVARAERHDSRPAGIYLIWAAYMLASCTLCDLAPQMVSRVDTIAFPLCLLATILIGRRRSRTAGMRVGGARPMIFWIGGAVLIGICCSVIPFVMPQIDGKTDGQLSLVMVGIFYFLGGVNYDRNFLWLGPVLCAAGLLVGFVPHYGWTIIGVLYAVGILSPLLFPMGPKPEAGNAVVA